MSERHGKTQPEREREGGREGEREREREGGREGEREREREREGPDKSKWEKKNICNSQMEFLPSSANPPNVTSGGGEHTLSLPGVVTHIHTDRTQTPPIVKLD